MANSIVKVTDVNDDMISDSLLLLVGEDGTVTPDKKTVENYLKKKSGPTNLQIMQIDKCDPKGIDMVVETVTYMPDHLDIVNEEDIVTHDETSDDDGVDVVAQNLINVQLDHDYTPLTSPKRADEEEDELAKTLSMLHGAVDSDPESAEPPALSPEVSQPGKANKGIKIISSFTIPAPSDTGTGSSQNDKEENKIENVETKTAPKAKGKAKILHLSPKKPLAKKPVKIVVQKEESSEEEEEEPDDEDELLENENDEEDEEEDLTDDDFDASVEDDDNDSDFDVKEVIGKKSTRATRRSRSQSVKREKPIRQQKIAAETSKTPKVKRVKQKLQKADSIEGDSTKPKPKLIKATDKEKATEKTEDTKTVESATKDSKAEPELSLKPEEAKPLDKKPPKKKKEPPKAIPGDFALFSTPDIIRKVGGKEPTTPGTPETPKTPKIGEQKAPFTHKAEATSKPQKIAQESRSKSISESQAKSNRSTLDESEKEKPAHRNSLDSKTKERRDSIDKQHNNKTHMETPKHSRVRKHSESERRISSSDRRPSDSTKRDYSPSKHSRYSGENQEPIPSAEDIRAIIMNEDTKTYTTNTIPIPDVPMSLNSNVESTNLNLDGSGLDLDQSILDNINNDMISEDILYQVAQQLVSNTELQNAIDKGINDGVLDTSSIMDTSQSLPPSLNTSYTEPPQSNIIREATQIVRPDGRVIILPPVERPTTRSRNKRKEEPPVVKAKPSFKTVHKPLDEEHVSGNELDSDGDEEEESEDDPNKLWCICNQPHNNRFMICCDTCEEWYHGKCVNITKAMGQQMEAEGKEWICLFCQDSSLKRPLAAARRIRKASRNSRQSTDSNNSNKKNGKEKVAAAMPCVVCQKPSRKNSIYCSEECILAHAQGVERVVVFERTTGNMLTGNKAPSATNLDQWLKQNPGYEVVRSAGKVVTTKVKPGQLTQSKLKLIKNPNNTGVSLAVQQKGVSIGVLKHAPKHPPEQLNQTPTKPKVIKIYQKESGPRDSKVKMIQPQPMPQVLKPKEVTPKPQKIQVQTLLAPNPKTVPVTPPVKTPKKEAIPKEQKKTPKIKVREEQQAPQATAPQAKQEDIRDNVQKTVFEQLLVRLKESDIKLTDEEVKNISIEIEAELYKCFGDTGQKYKNKYRSLIFNIKDPKNQTLWRRICEKSISSYELVRLSPDDMASQELAKWREQEAKHQLDMIKKSEIELLNCNRQYVLKTHKGEEVLEDNRSTNKVDNTEIIKSLTEGSTLDTGVDAKGGSKDKERDKEKRSLSKHKSRDKERHSSREKRKDKDHKRRSSSRDRSRKRSKSRDKSRSRHDKKKKRSRSSSRDRSRGRSRDRKNRDKDKDKKKSSHKTSRHSKDTHSKIISSTDSLDQRSKEILEQLNKIAPPVEERLWKHVTQEDIVPGVAPADSDSDHEVPSSTVTIPTPPGSQEAEDFPSISSDDSKTSLRSKENSADDERGLSPPPKKPPSQIWAGTINMVDVAQISITAHEVSGDCSGLSKELSENLDIVGRISPDTVWDYIGKMRSSNSKIISLIRLNATNVEEQMPYLALYSYLSSRNRLGVVKSTTKAIKDFYILPLAAQKPIPQALLPINGPGFEEARPALLLGIIVRDKRKRGHSELISQTMASHTPHKKTRIEVHVVKTPPPRSYTPPPVPPEVAPVPPPPLPPPPKIDPRLAKLAQPPLPPMVLLPDLRIPPPPLPPLPSIHAEIPKLSPAMMSIVKPGHSSPNLIEPKIEANDDDEPYSPGDSDPDTTVPDIVQSTAILTTTQISLTQATITTEYAPTPSVLPGGGSELSATKIDMQRKMEELNKQIEMQKSEISSITKNIATAADSEIVGSALANIALPSNLQQILDSIKTIGSVTAQSETSTESIVVDSKPSTTQIDLTIPLMIPKTFSRPLTGVPPPDLSSSIPLNLPSKSRLTTPPQLNSPGQEKSVLSSLTEEDLIRKAAEMLKSKPEPSKPVPPPPPRVSFHIGKKPKLDVNLPPVPGVDD
ncbi:death-inducer obliterator 1 isoform X2 [Anthonomus grandis grandis]|uniref:death-inducer obliterator 1 isoform X2 n=1 Tax=Anthonomus grandis grandis TaxID=2921223 RepID=UPI00216661D0|nr:death-inducer obliterator 1 isoform X2 [Anthonomus grandis grandis]